MLAAVLVLLAFVVLAVVAAGGHELPPPGLDPEECPPDPYGPPRPPWCP